MSKQQRETKDPFPGAREEQEVGTGDGREAVERRRRVCPCILGHSPWGIPRVSKARRGAYIHERSPLEPLGRGDQRRRSRSYSIFAWLTRPGAVSVSRKPAPSAPKCSYDMGRRSGEGISGGAPPQEPDDSMYKLTGAEFCTQCAESIGSRHEASGSPLLLL